MSSNTVSCQWGGMISSRFSPIKLVTWYFCVYELSLTDSVKYFVGSMSNAIPWDLRVNILAGAIPNSFKLWNFAFFSVFHSEDWSQTPEWVPQVCCLGFFSLSERNFYECHLFCLYSLCRCMFTFITHTVQPYKVSWDLLRFQKKEKINFKSPEKVWQWQPWINSQKMTK